MNKKSLILGTLASFVVMFGVGFVWHIGLFETAYHKLNYASRAEILMPFIIFGELIRAFLMAFIYPYGYKGGLGLTEGLRFGLLSNLLIAGTMLPIVFGLHNLTNFSCYVLLEGGFLLLTGGIGGIVIGAIHEKMKT
ncbi:MAG: hypothetical protein ACI9BD_001557 [Candidatus Marinamargulisbacteria bacterium]|jgi:hypothetical protein